MWIRSLPCNFLQKDGGGRDSPGLTPLPPAAPEKVHTAHNPCKSQMCSQGTCQARIVGWIDMTSSRGSSQLRVGTCISWVSCIGCTFFTTELPRKPHEPDLDAQNHILHRPLNKDIFLNLWPTQTFLGCSHFCNISQRFKGWKPIPRVKTHFFLCGDPS